MMTSTTAPHETSNWMREALAVVVGDIEPILGKVPENKSLKVSLTRMPESPEDRQRWARSCDRCGVYVAPGGELYAGSEDLLVQGRHVIVPWALCRTCAQLEHPEKFQGATND